MKRMDGQLLRFRVANHRSLRDEQEFSFIASPSDKGDKRLLHPAGVDEPVLPVCALFGANASGKSNLLDALGFMQEAVAISQRRWDPLGGVPRTPFALSERREEASSYVVDLAISGTRYEYGFVVDDQMVREEWLRAWPNGRRQEWFARDKQQFEFGRSLRGENKAIETLTRANSLFLSAAAQNNHAQLMPLFVWFALRFRGSASFVSGSGWRAWWRQFSDSPEVPQAEEELQAQRAQVRSLLQKADLGIDDFQVIDEAISESEGNTPRKQRTQQIRFAHHSKEQLTWLDFEDESTGTQALIQLLPSLLPILKGGGLVAIDELNFFHPMLVLALVQLFQDPDRNPRGAQLLFNTHDATLLGTLLADPPPLRRDQIWLTEKDRAGATHLYPLTDYTPRAAENLERGYLQGRYGAVPFLAPLDPLHARGSSEGGHGG